MTSPLPLHASVLAHDGVWMESDAVLQLARISLLPACARAVGMPDLHPGRGIPIGAAFLFEGCVRPELVGGDAGCGVLVIVGHKEGPRGDVLERRVLAALEEPLLPEVDRRELLRCAWELGPRGLSQLRGMPEGLVEIAMQFTSDTGPSGELPDDARYAEQLGSIGGGNHFAEISRVGSIIDKARARAMGFHIDAQALLVHSGSRALGSSIAERYAKRVFAEPEAEAYLADLRGAIRYARTNRLLVAYRLLPL